MKNWNEKVLAGMKLIKEGCSQQNPYWDKCSDCPFDSCCDAIRMASKKSTYPSDWFTKKEEELS